MRDTVLDWGDALPEAELAASEAAADAAGLALCLGTSLQVAPACDVPLRTARRGARHYPNPNLKPRTQGAGRPAACSAAGTRCLGAARPSPSAAQGWRRCPLRARAGPQTMPAGLAGQRPPAAARCARAAWPVLAASQQGVRGGGRAAAGMASEAAAGGRRWPAGHREPAEDAQGPPRCAGHPRARGLRHGRRHGSAAPARAPRAAAGAAPRRAMRTR
jgi:hypothetical protein